jgi:hypothetical protein
MLPRRTIQTPDLLEKTGICGAGVPFMIRKACLAVLFAATTSIPAFAAEPATLLGVFQNWSAYSTGSGDTLTCYALSQPKATSPKGAKRGPIYLMVSDWPGRKAKAEPQFVLGYPVKENAAAALAVGSTKFPFFARANGKSDASAWLQSLNDNGRLIDAMGKGVSVVASGVSARGTKTSDTYSLAGFSDALAKIHAVCKM